MIKLMTCAHWFHKYACEISDLLLAVKMLVNQQEREEKEQIFFVCLFWSGVFIHFEILNNTLEPGAGVRRVPRHLYNQNFLVMNGGFVVA